MKYIKSIIIVAGSPNVTECSDWILGGIFAIPNGLFVYFILRCLFGLFKIFKMNTFCCRVCLNETELESLHLQYEFEKIGITTLAGLLQNLTNLKVCFDLFSFQFRKIMKFQVSRDDFLPQLVCKDCKAEIVSAVYLKERILKMDAYLRNILEIGLDSSVEDFQSLEGNLMEQEETTYVTELNEGSYEEIISEDMIKSEDLVEELQEEEPEPDLDSTIIAEFQEEPQVLQFIESTRKPNEQNKTCNICKKSFKCYSLLLYHNKTIHSQDFEYFVCDLDGKKIKHKVNLVRHMRLVHKQIRNFKCLICNDKKFEYKTSHLLNKHNFQFHNQRPNFVCQDQGCNFKCTYESELLTHFEAKQHGLQSSYADKIKLKEVFTCPTCNKKFNYKSNLSRHQMIHQNIKNFSCSYCKKSFVQKTQRDSHERTHTGQRPFSCSVCKRAFSDYSTWTKHRKKLHAKVE
jgi:stress-induced morphogen